MLLQCIEDLSVPNIGGDPDDSVYVVEGEIVPARNVEIFYRVHGLCIEVRPEIEVIMRKKDAFEHFKIIEY